MKSSEKLIPGEIYILQLGGSKWIFRVKEIRSPNIIDRGPTIFFSSPKSGKAIYDKSLSHGWHVTTNMEQFSRTTPEEKRWLETCESEGKFVPLEEVGTGISYEIF